PCATNPNIAAFAPSLTHQGPTWIACHWRSVGAFVCTDDHEIICVAARSRCESYGSPWSERVIRAELARCTGPRLAIIAPPKRSASTLPNVKKSDGWTLYRRLCRESVVHLLRTAPTRIPSKTGRSPSANTIFATMVGEAPRAARMPNSRMRCDTSYANIP